MNIKPIQKILATAMVAAAAHGPCVHASEGPHVPGLGQVSVHGTETLSFSTTFVSVLSAVGVRVSQTDPAALQITRRNNGRYASVSIAAPLSAVSTSFIGRAVAIDSISTQGGALFMAPDDAFATSGGALGITSLRVDLVGKKIFADLNGANGVGWVSNVYLWDIGTITGATSIDVLAGIQSLNTELTGLKITTGAFALFSQSLGLLEAGSQALSVVTDFGKITSSITLVPPPLVPEPSTSAMMGLGLLAVLGMRMARRPPQPRAC